MNKLYILICTIVLSGCGYKPLTVEEITKANKYCEDHNLKLLVSSSVWDKKEYKTIIDVACVSDKNQYAIPKEALK